MHDFQPALADVPAAALVSAMDGADDALAIFTADEELLAARIVYINDAMVRLTGYAREDLVGHSARLLAGARPHAGHAREAFEAMRAARPYVATTRKYRPDASFYDVEVRIAPVRGALGAVTHYVLAQRDVTDRRRERAQIEAHLLAAERAASLGRLAAGAADAMAGDASRMVADLESTESALAYGAPPEDLSPRVARALDAARGVERALRRLRSILALDDGADEIVDVHDALELALELTAHEVRSRACLTRSYGPAPRVRGDLGRLARVFVNVLRNAAEAIPRAMPLANTVHVRTDASTDDAVVVEIEDTGVGIAPDDVARVFDPFVTTKRRGDAFGLGLTVARAAILQMRGSIALHSTAGHGTRVRIVLPAAGADEPRDALPRFVREDPPLRRVLVAAPSLAAARELGRMLEDARTRVQLATFDAALEALAMGEPCDLVACDAADGEGDAFVARLCELAPEAVGRTFLVDAPRDPSGVYRVTIASRAALHAQR